MGIHGPLPTIKLRSEALADYNPPEWLIDAVAVSYWKRHVAMLCENQILTQSTVESFALLCDLWSKVKGCAGQDITRQYLDSVRSFTALAKQFRLMPTEKPNIKEARFASFKEVDLES